MSKIPLNAKSTTEEIRTRFDSDVERFSNLDTGQESTIDALLSLELISSAAVASTPHARSVLDIGCGAGNASLKLLQKRSPLDFDLADLSQPMLEKAFERISAVNTGTVRTFHGDIRKIELPLHQYDIILAIAVLHHLREDSDWEQTFQKIYSLTAPGGSVWISDLVSHNHAAVQELMWSRYGEYLESHGGTEYRQKVFDYIEKEDSPRSIDYQLDLLRKCGFEQVDILHKNSCFAVICAIKAK